MTKADYLHDDLTRLNGALVAEILGEDRPCVRIAREALAKAEGREA